MLGFKMDKIWIVDDDRSIRWVLEKALTREQLPVRVFESAQQVLQALLTDRPAVLLSDIRMGEMDGLTLVKEVKAKYPSMPVIIMTAFSDLESAVGAFRAGAYEYLAKPFDVAQAVALLKRAYDEAVVSTEQAENTSANEPLESHTQVVSSVESQTVAQMPDMIGHSRAMQEIFRAIGRLAHSNVTVLLTGESGVGKEVVARALHRHSSRAQNPFVAINTAAIPRELLESELFGHEKGAFTGANQQKLGRFEQAKGGTLFLDEIGDMPMDLQTRLLRVLSDGCFYRVGGCVSIRSEVRVIAATNQNLLERVKAGLFREDLYHRLNVIHLELPPLRERLEDVPDLADAFLAQAAQKMQIERKRLTPEALKRLQTYHFPGNVRELENICHWLTVMAPSTAIHEADLPNDLLQAEPLDSVIGGVPTGSVAVNSTQNHGPSRISAHYEGAEEWDAGLYAQVLERLREGDRDLMATLLARFERTVYQAALDYTEGKKSLAAEQLGVGRNTMTRKIQEFQLHY